MFKKNSIIAKKYSTRARSVQPRILSFIAVFFLIYSLAGCQSAPPLPPVNLSVPGWTVRQGQAVWRAKKEAPEITGEVLAATNPDGRGFVQFTITPFPLIVAQTASNSWQIHDVRANRTFTAWGNPPARVVWLQLPRCLSGAAPTGGWQWQRSGDGQFQLRNSRSGETLEGFLNP
jgi:hypothetical protein